MTSGRILLFVAGLLVAVGAALLVNRGIQGFGVVESAESDSGSEVDDGDRNNPLAEWVDYARPGAGDTPVPRPVEGTDFAAANPFEPSQTRATLELLALRLDGVAPGDGGPDALAMISGQVVRIGDTIDDFQIAEISKFGVTLASSTGVRVELGLGMSTAPPAAQTPRAMPEATGWATPSPPKFLATVSRAARVDTDSSVLAVASRRAESRAGQAERFPPLSELDAAIDRDAARRRELWRGPTGPFPQMPENLWGRYDRGGGERRQPPPVPEPLVRPPAGAPAGGP